jgi:hypothetical protein
MKRLLILGAVLVVGIVVFYQLDLALSTKVSASSKSEGTIPAADPNPHPVPIDGALCPDIETCHDQGCPHTSTQCTTIDSGLTSCTQPDGSLLQCSGGQTVKQKTCKCATFGACSRFSDLEPPFCG